MLASKVRTGRLVGRGRALVAAVLCGVLAAALADSGAQAAPKPPVATPQTPLKSQTEPLDHLGREVTGTSPVVPTFDNTPPPAPVWPSAGKATASIAAPAATVSGKSATAANGQRKVGKLPVWVTAAPGQQADVDVEVLQRAKVPVAWRDGLVVKFKQTAGKPVKISLGYDSFRFAYGADWASRLKLWQLPTCAVSTAPAPTCQATELPSTNDTAAGKVSATVAASGSAGTVIALAAAASGSSGDFSASPLSESSTWSASGEFTWSYPMRVPPSVSGLAPEVGLSYSSDSVDGRSAASNNQPSWVGEGFDYTPGFIERKYIPCALDMDGNNNNTAKTGDQCWQSSNAILSLGGRSTELIFQSGNTWRARSEDGSIIERLTGADNKDDNGEHWVVTTTDGTKYFFGRDKLPGQPYGTNSTWYTRVYGNHPDEPCHAAAFADSGCDQAWRWNLDYVQDARGNTMSYWYNREMNRYARNATKGDLVEYVRGGTLRSIKYGTWDRTQTSGTLSKDARAEVVFTVADRCKSDCTTHGANWPDVPWDQECVAGNKECDNYSPTYWSTNRLSQVTTSVWDTSLATPKVQNVDSWSLTADYPSPNDGTHAGLWLKEIVHTGLVGTATSLPPVTLSPTTLPNRVLTANNTTFNWQRLGSIISETGAKTLVTYSLPECTAANTVNLDAHTNTMLCYPVVVPHPSDPAEGDITEWWHKYVVRQISQTDTPLTGGNTTPIMNTYYGYGGKPAWHYADDDGFTKPSRKTWSGFRGYETVETRVGEQSGPQTLTVTKFLRGLHGDRAARAGGQRSVTVSASLGAETVYDEDQFAGMVREQTVYDGSTSKPVSKTVNVPWRSAPTASRTINGDTAEARFVNTRVTYAGTALGVDGARGWRVTSAESVFNDDGTVKTQQDNGDTAKSGDEQCVTTTYDNSTNNVTKHFVGLVQLTSVRALTCGSAVRDETDVVSDEHFDYNAFGEVIVTQRLKTWSPTGSTFQTVESATYDDFGRAKTQTDVRGNTTTTTYTPADRPTATVDTVTDEPYKWKSSVKLAPYWGQPKLTTNPLGETTEADYDSLGRTTNVWLAGWAKSANPTSPSKSFQYTFASGRNAYPSVMTRTLNAAGGYNTAYALYDGFMRPRQTQTWATDNVNRVVTDTLYDQYGRTVTSYPAHAESGAPSGALLVKPEWSLRLVKRNVYDQAGRQRGAITLAGDGVSNLVEQWRTTTVPEGDLAKVTPPLGGTPTTTVVDAQGRTRELRLHTTSSGVNGAYDTTAYTYNRKNQLAETVDPGGNIWTTTYDLLGRPSKQKDPDKGAVTLTYNDFDDPVTSTDTRGIKLITKYDDLGRKYALYETSETPDKLRAEWKYDFVEADGSKVPGQLVESVRWHDKLAYRQTVIGIDPKRHQPVAVEYTVPTTDAGFGGIYLYTFGYSVFDGTANEIVYPNAGGLITEQVTTRYDAKTGLPALLDTGYNNVTSYVTKQEYSKLGEPTVTFRKMNGLPYVQSTTEYETATRRVHRLQVKPETSGIVVDRTYEYDDAGNTLSLLDAPAVGDSEKQCFTYDKLRRLVSAWTPKTAAVCMTAPTVDTLAGPAPYWTDWTIDKLGNRGTQTAHAKAGDTTKTYTVPVPGKDVVRPHAVTSVTTKTPGKTDVTAGYQYDAAGNMNRRYVSPTLTQTVNWDPEGRVSTVVEGTNNFKNIYDADGNRLIHQDSSGYTLYLPGMELKHAAGTTTVKGTRYYQFAGQTIASRTADGVQWLYTDYQGSQNTTVHASTLKVSIRRQTPYGEPRGTQGMWPNNKGFVGGDIDSNGLTHVGAREYDPGLGRFISVDPLMDLADPQQWNGYAYSNNNPTSFSDPSGLMIDTGNGSGNGQRINPKNNQVLDKGQNGNTKGYSNRYGRNGTVATVHESGKTTINGVTPLRGGPDIQALAAGVDRARGDYRGLEWCSPGCDYDTLDMIFNACSLKYVACSKGYIFRAQLDRMAAFCLEIGCGGEGGNKALLRNKDAYQKTRKDLRCSTGKNSFSADTEVLMADGRTKIISKIEAGDMVMATDPETGRAGPREVLETHINDDTELTDLKIRVGRKAEAVVRTTQDHPFWNAALQEWVNADSLHGRTRLSTLSRSPATVIAARSYIGRRLMYNLTVEDIHTYYVMAGNTPVLVHNCGGETLYRSDTRDPSEVFQTGFDPRGNNMDVLEHASGWSKNSGYVSTTRSENVAIRRGGNVYEVRAGGVDVNKEFPGNPFSHEQEVAVPGRIGPECIVACRLTDGTRVINPNYGGR